LDYFALNQCFHFDLAVFSEDGAVEPRAALETPRAVVSPAAIDLQGALGVPAAVDFGDALRSQNENRDENPAPRRPAFQNPKAAIQTVL
jgi:hypothetical protein